jgi:hypothetical protein
MEVYKITSIRFNSGSENLRYIVGEVGVTEIKEHASRREDDKWYWDVCLDNGSVHRIFNPTDVFYKQTKS